METNEQLVVDDVERVKRARDLLREARKLLKEANCPKTVERVRLALSSIEGAVRNVESRRFNEGRRVRKQIHRAPKMFVGTFKTVNEQRYVSSVRFK